jgi:hypothetical protein
MAAGEECLDRLNDQPVHRFGAFLVGLVDQRLQQLGIALDGFIGDGFHVNSP